MWAPIDGPKFSKLKIFSSLNIYIFISVSRNAITLVRAPVAETIRASPLFRQLTALRDGQLAVPWVYLCDLSCAIEISYGYSVWCCNL